TEVANIFNADSAGKCRTCVSPLGTLVSWWPGDGNPDDIKDGNNPTGSFGTAQFIPAKVGQGMKFDGSNGYIVADNANLNFGTASFSIDGWIRVDTLPATTSVLVEKRLFVNPTAAGYV